MRSIPWRTAVSVLVFAIGLASPVVGQDANAPAAPAEQQPVVEQQQATMLQQQQQMAGPDLLKRMKARVSVDFREAPMEDVIKSLAQQADIDIVKGPSVTGSVTATLTDVPLDEAMDSIFTVHGFGYTTSESIVRIVPKSELAQYMIKFQTKVYHIDYADIDAMNKALKDMLSPQGKIAMNLKTGHLWITDTEQKIKMFDEVIEAMDRETPQILVEARIYDVSCSVFLDFGFDWSAGTVTVFDADTGAPIGGRTSPFATAGFASSITSSPKASAGLRLGVLNDDINIETTFSAARDDIKARLLANPKILVLNAQAASIKIVSEIPYQELTQTSGGGNIGTTKFKEVGVELLVTPQLARDGKIRLTLKPKFSVQTGTVSMAIPSGLSSISSPQPIVDTREAQTFALIRDGQTVVIGGLRKRDVVQEVSRVPLLSDIPLLGELFKFRGEKAVNSELIVFITPHLITEPALTPSDTRKLDTMNNDIREPTAPKVMFDSGKENPEDGEQ